MGLDEEIARLDALAAAEEGKKPEDEDGEDTLAGDGEGEDTNEGGEDTLEGGVKKPAAAPAAKTPEEEAAAALAAKAAAPALDPNDEKNPASVYYKLRVAQREKEALAEELKAAKNPAAAIPDANEDPEGHLAARIAANEELIKDVLGYVGQDLASKKAEAELENAFTALSPFEEKLKTTRPDYEAARDHLSRVYAEEFMLHNPNLKGKPLITAVAKQIIAVADAASQRGIDPAAFLLSRAEAMGYRPAAAKAADDGKPPAKAEAKTPSLAKVAENKKKSSGMPRSNGGVAELTNDAVMEMTNAERAKLTPSDWARLEAQA